MKIYTIFFIVMECTGGRVYLSCGPPVQLACGSANTDDYDKPSQQIDLKTCMEGCFCPTGTLYHDGKCVTKEECPCRLRGKQFAPGSTIPKDCNTWYLKYIIIMLSYYRYIC